MYLWCFSGEFMATGLQKREFKEFDEEEYIYKTTVSYG